MRRWRYRVRWWFATPSQRRAERERRDAFLMAAPFIVDDMLVVRDFPSVFARDAVLMLPVREWPVSITIETEEER